jgi:type II secretory pathway predicted ATPase ExeA
MEDTPGLRSRCIGRCTVSAKVNGETKRYIEQRAEQAGITPAEFLRRLLDLYRASERGETSCPNCQAGVNLPAAINA